MKRNEQILGATFPGDFKEFGRVYGTGRLMVGNPADGTYTLRIFSPSFPSYPAMVERFVDIYDEYRRSGEVGDLDLEPV